MIDEHKKNEQPQMSKQKEKNDVTPYAEFIPSFDSWLGSDHQKKKAEELEDI